MSVFTLDAYKGWSIGRLKRRCRELARAELGRAYEQERVINKLINAARDVMHHDADEDDASYVYEHDTLTKKFKAILNGR